MNSIKSDTDIVLLSPCFNDWESIQALIVPVDKELQKLGTIGRWVIVNDGSTENNHLFDLSGCSHLKQLDIIHLNTNIGAQKALAIGLCFISDNIDHKCLVVIDSDGEDKPEDITCLVKTCMEDKEHPSIVFAERKIRSEGVVFTIFYNIYRLMHLILTGSGIKVGNFSAIHPRCLDAVVNDNDLWNHYAASVYKSKIPIKTIPTTRGKRITGKSHMNFTALVLHGLSAIFCYAETIGVRVLIGVMLAFFLWLLLGIFFIIFSAYGKGFGGMAQIDSILFMMGWLFLLQILFMGMGFVGLILHGRKSHVYIPKMFYKQYIHSKDSEIQ